MSDEKRIPITYKNTGEMHLSDPRPKKLSKRPESVQPSASQAAMGAREPIGASANERQEGRDEAKPQGKGKPEIETLAQFIENAYRLKGRKVSLNEAVERRISQAVRLSDEARAGLARLAREDRLFAVPRQLLLASRGVHGYRNLREELRAFVRDAMLAHELFSPPELQAVIQDLADAPEPRAALERLLEVKQDAAAGDASAYMKPAEIEELRTNAAYCLAAWLADSRNLSLADVAEMLQLALWGPRARQLDQETARLRTLTEVQDIAAVGLACHQFRQRAIERTAKAGDAIREADAARARATSLESELEALREGLASTEDELERVRREGEQALAALRAEVSSERAHLHDDLEQLRTRVLRRLMTDIDQLEVGLEALRAAEPRVHVIQDRVERVVDALRSEVNKLKGV
jgi:hypothetical protein